MIRRPLAIAVAALMLGATLVPDASAQSAVVEGVAQAQDGGAAIPFALVRLVAADATALSQSALQQGITSADGRYRFVHIPAGRYRVQLLRIGFKPVLSDAVQVASGETVQLPLRVASQPLELPTMQVVAGVCVPAKELTVHPQIFALWQQARDGSSVRTELMARYRYRILVHEESYELRDDGPTPPGTLDQTSVSDPKWAVKNAARSRSLRLSRGYFGSNDGFWVPNELEVLHDDFLKEHCLISSTEHADGEVGIRFQPLRTRRNIVDIGGVIWLDSSTYLAKRLELEYIGSDVPRGTVRVDFDDLPVAGGTLRMPARAAFAMRPSLKNPLRRTEGKLTYRYSEFVEVPPR